MLCLEVGVVTGRQTWRWVSRPLL